MSLFGARQGVNAATVLALDFADGTYSDLSPAAQAVTLVSTGGPLPYWIGGPYGDAMQFDTYGETAQFRRVSVAHSGTLNPATIGTWDFAFYDGRTGADSDGAYIAAQYSTSAGGLSWEIFLDADGRINVRIDDGTGTIDSIIEGTDGPEAAALHVYIAQRWYWCRFVLDLLNGWLYLYRDGQLVAKKSTAIAQLRTASLGPVQIGAHVVTAQTNKHFAGRVGEFHLRAEVDTDSASCPVNFSLRDRISTKQYHVAEIDIGEMVQSLTWTATGGGGFYAAQAALALGSLIADADDVVSLVLTSTAGVETTLTKVGNAAEVDATNNTFCWVESTGRLHAKPQPSASDQAKVRITYRCSDKSQIIAGRYYRGTLMSADSGTLATAYMFKPLPMGGGARVDIARQHTDHPASFSVEANSRIIWPGSPIRLYRTSDCIPWCERKPEFVGLIETAPPDDRDVFSLQSMPVHALLESVAVETNAITADDYSDAPTESLGHVFPFIYGTGNLRVPAKCIEQTATTIGSYTAYKCQVSAHHIARMSRFGRGTYSGLPVLNVDLDAGTFYSTNWPSQLTAAWVDVDGFGDASDPTSPDGVPVTSWGDAADCIVTPWDWLQAWMTRFCPLLTWSGGSGADTATRIELLRRAAEVMSARGSAGTELHRFFSETITFLVPFIDGTYGWKDIDKTAAATAVLLDSDLVTFDPWRPEVDSLAREALVMASEYTALDDGTVRKGSLARLTTRAESRLDIPAEWYPPPGGSGQLSRFLTVGSAEAWLALVRSFFEITGQLRTVTVGASKLGLEVMDVLTDGTTNAQAGASARLRVLSRTPLGNGTMKLELFPETLFPADSSQSGVIRDAYGPCQQFDWCEAGGQALANRDGSGYGSVADDAYRVWQPCDGFPATGVTQTAVVYGVSSSAVATDVQVRLRDLTNSLTLATFNLPNAAGFVSASVANIPAAEAILVLEYQTANGATGTLRSCSWESEETAAVPGDPVSPTVMHAVGSRAGWSLSTAGREPFHPTRHMSVVGKSTALSLADSVGAWLPVNDHCEILPSGWYGFPAGGGHSIMAFVKRIGGGADSDLQFRVRELDTPATIATIAAVTTSEALVSTTTVANLPSANKRIAFEYKTENGASGTFRSAAWEFEELTTPASASPAPEACYSEGSAAGASCPSAGAGVVRTVPLRAGAFSAQPDYWGDNDYAHAPTSKIRYRAFVYVNIGTAVNFRPLIYFYWYYNSGNQTKQGFTAADFGVINASGLYSVDLSYPTAFSAIMFEVVPHYYSDSGTATIHAVGVFQRFLDVSVSSNYLTVPCRVGSMLATALQPPGLKAQWALKANGTGCTGFNPVVVGTTKTGLGNGGEFDDDPIETHVIADFGEITTDGIHLATGISGVLTNPTGLELRYICTVGTPTVNGLSVAFVYPESGGSGIPNHHKPLISWGATQDAAGSVSALLELAATGAGNWTVIDGYEELRQGALEFEDDIALYFEINFITTQWATGNLLFRVYDVTNSVVIASAAPTSGDLTYAIDQSLDNALPAANARLQLQYVLIGPTTCAFYKALFDLYKWQ